MSFANKTIILTGASAGIGQALALSLAQQGANLVLAARNQAALEETVAACTNQPGSAITQGLCISEASFDFAQIFSEGGVEDSVPPYSREGRVRSLCQLHQGKFALDTAKSILRDHQGHICMHGEFETRGSQISRLSSQQGQHWLIDRPFPCQQNYKLIAFPTTALFSTIDAMPRRQQEMHPRQ
jgi:hypothetical protein